MSTKTITKADVLKLPLACARCNRIVQCKPTQGGNPRPPGGWTVVADGYWCGECWNEMYVPRVVTIGVTTDDWEALRKTLKESFGAARSLANWAYSALLSQEPPRDPLAEKMPKKPNVYLYGLAKNHCPFWGLLPATLANTVLRQVESDYAADRYEVVWTGARSTRNYRYPVPLPIPEANYSITKTDDGYSASLSVAGGQRITVALATRKHQRRILDSLLSTPILRGACKVIESRSYADGEKNARVNGNGSPYSSRIRLMISYYAPRLTVPASLEGEWRVSTGPDSLLIAADADSQEVWRYHADHVKRITCRHADHLARLSRLSDDRKAETRKPRRAAKPRLAMLDARSERDRSRLRSACHEISAHLVAAAKRRKIARITYTDKDHSFCESFPWAMLRGMIDQKSRQSRIIFDHANGSVPKKRRPPLAVKTTDEVQ